MPLVTIKTGFSTPDGREEVLTEYLCDWPGCATIAVHRIGCVPGLRMMALVCEEHTPPAQRQRAS